MKLVIEITTDNAAFEDSPSREVSRILRKFADGIDGDRLAVGDYAPLRDVNGNGVGDAKVVSA